MSAERPETAHPETAGNENGEDATSSTPTFRSSSPPPVPGSPGAERPAPSAPSPGDADEPPGGRPPGPMPGGGMPPPSRPSHFTPGPEPGPGPDPVRGPAPGVAGGRPAHLAAPGRGPAEGVPGGAGGEDATRQGDSPVPPAPPYDQTIRFGNVGGFAGLGGLAGRRGGATRPRLPGAGLLRGRLALRGRRRSSRHPGMRGGASRPTEGRWIDYRMRHIHAGSVLRVAGLFYVCVFLTLMVAGFLLWNVGRSTETIDQLEGFITRLGAYGRCVPEDSLEPGTDFERDEDCPDGRVLVEGFRFNDGTLFRTALFGGIVLVVAGTGATVLLTLLFNLLTEVTGGVRYTAIREQQRPPPRSPDPPIRR
jgi:hypothetical protein